MTHSRPRTFCHSKISLWSAQDGFRYSTDDRRRNFDDADEHAPASFG
jgi:hypothetical protein